MLGTDFYVTRSENVITARARKSGEPELSKRRLRMSARWLTIPQAAAELGMTEQWFRSQYTRTGKVEKFRFGTRVVVQSKDVAALKGTVAPGGVFVGRIGA